MPCCIAQFWDDSCRNQMMMKICLEMVWQRCIAVDNLPSPNTHLSISLSKQGSKLMINEMHGSIAPFKYYKIRCLSPVFLFCSVQCIDYINRFAPSIFESIATMLVSIQVYCTRSLFFCFVQCILVVELYATKAFEFVTTLMVSVAFLRMLL